MISFSFAVLDTPNTSYRLHFFPNSFQINSAVDPIELTRQIERSEIPVMKQYLYAIQLHMSMLHFGKGEHAQVAIITGAGRGLGRAWACALAERGVRIVVNDNDPDKTLVNDVVNYIRSCGGIAMGDYHCVTDGAKIVEAAMKEYGRIDILINVSILFCIITRCMSDPNGYRMQQ